MSDVPYLFFILFTKLANVIFCTKRHPVAVNCFFFLHQLFVQDAITTCAQTLLRCLNHGAYHEILGLVRQHDCSRVVLLYLPMFHALVVKQIVTVVITDCEVGGLLWKRGKWPLQRGGRSRYVAVKYLFEHRFSVQHIMYLLTQWKSCTGKSGLRS